MEDDEYEYDLCIRERDASCHHDVDVPCAHCAI